MKTHHKKGRTAKCHPNNTSGYLRMSKNWEAVTCKYCLRRKPIAEDLKDFERSVPSYSTSEEFVKEAALRRFQNTAYLEKRLKAIEEAQKEAIKPYENFNKAVREFGKSLLKAGQCAVDDINAFGERYLNLKRK